MSAMEREARKHKRFRVPLVMRVRLISGEDRRQTSRLYRTHSRDISLGGVSIITPVLRLDGLHFLYNRLPTVRNQMLMKLSIPDDPKPVVALGYALHARTVKFNGRQAYVVGIHFLQISEGHGERLRSFLDEF